MQLLVLWGRAAPSANPLYLFSIKQERLKTDINVWVIDNWLSDRMGILGKWSSYYLIIRCLFISDLILCVVFEELPL